MDSSKSSSTSGPQDTNSDANDEEKSDLCPGFKDVDAFVKVSEAGRRVSEFGLTVRWATWMCLLASSCGHIIS